MLRLSFVIFLLCLNSYALDVLITKESINFEQKIKSSQLRLLKTTNLKKSCVPLTLNQIQNKEYLANHYINKNSILCQRDVREYKDNSVIFDFGSIQIEKKGKIIFENDKFIRIKKEDGKIEKIYKDGSLK